jgi:hypothetical protein
MVDTYYAGVYWLARHESAEACARRAEVLFRLLGRCEPTWSRWCETANSFEEARERPFIPGAAAFTRLFSRKENQSGDGFNYWLWTGGSPEEAIGVHGACGFSEGWVPSTCVLSPPDEGLIAERLLTASVMAEVVRAMALAWEPDWGVATSHAHRDNVSKEADAGTFVGWVMYFSRQRGAVPPLPAPVRVEPVEDKGTLVVLTPERFTVENPEHVALAAHVHELLDRAGLLHPLRPFGS